jgi:hypothetical protein
LLIFLDNIKLDTDTLSRAHPNELPDCRRRLYLHNTQQTQKNNIHALIGVQTRDPRNETAANIQRRSHSRQFRRSYIAFCHHIECRYLLDTNIYIRIKFSSLVLNHSPMINATKLSSTFFNTVTAVN